MYNPPDKKLNKICITQRYQRIDERSKGGIQSANRRSGDIKVRRIWRQVGKEIFNVRIKLEEQLGRTINILQISTRDEKIDIYNKSMENFNRQLRKVTKSKAIYPNDYSLMKSLYLAMADASSKWKGRIRNWDMVIAQLSIYFEGRI